MGRKDCRFSNPTKVCMTPPVGPHTFQGTERFPVVPTLRNKTRHKTQGSKNGTTCGDAVKTDFDFVNLRNIHRILWNLKKRTLHLTVKPVYIIKKIKNLKKINLRMFGKSFLKHSYFSCVCCWYRRGSSTNGDRCTPMTLTQIILNSI